MSRPGEHPLTTAGKRGVAAILGLLLGLLVGLLGGIALVGFGDVLLVVIGVAGVGGAVLGWFVPAPFLFVAGLVFSIAGGDA